ncbi:MAG TPA: alanine--glyoxylate aminotransferase family protein, partial [Gammaproteobacteria bacterium]|nr:alanine--glyoxylate aminotransferase family protein [Gammaproteobacteria bacterium]
DLKKWREIMEAYENGGHAYYTTMPTDALARTCDAMAETRASGFQALRARQLELGLKVRALLAKKGLPSVAADGFEAPGVVVSYTDDDALSSGKGFLGAGLQAAGGVPLQCDEPADFKTFRIGLFGLEKLQHVDRTVATLEEALSRICRTRATGIDPAP